MSLGTLVVRSVSSGQKCLLWESQRKRPATHPNIMFKVISNNVSERGLLTALGGADRFGDSSLVFRVQPCASRLITEGTGVGRTTRNFITKQSWSRLRSDSSLIKVVQRSCCCRHPKRKSHEMITSAGVQPCHNGYRFWRA